MQVCASHHKMPNTKPLPCDEQLCREPYKLIIIQRFNQNEELKEFKCTESRACWF